MERASLDAVETDRFGAGCQRRSLGAALGTTDVAVNHYRVAPGERLPTGLHAHADQEEVFVVLTGEATFETLLPDGARTPEAARSSDRERGCSAGEVTVAAGEAVGFEPGDYQAGRNDGDVVLELLALGAPRESEDIRLPVTCPACEHDFVQLRTGGENPSFVCPASSTERVPAPCPACESEDLRVTLRDECEAEEVADERGEEGGDGEDGEDGEQAAHPATIGSPVVVICDDCGATYARPPVRETW